MRDYLILRPFNGLFFLLFAAFGLVFLVLSFLVRRRPDRVRRRVLAGLMLATLAFFIWYKVMLSLDAEYSALSAAAGKGEFNWWGELPLHLCNINMILIPVGVLLKKRSLMSFSFFLGPLGALMALMMPGVGFENCSILLPRMLGYYGTHFMVFYGGLALWTFGIYRPRFRDILPATLSALALCFVIFLVNLAFRGLGLNRYSNYFYNVETEGNPVLELFHSWLPYPFLYMIPCLLIGVPYMLIVTAAFFMIRPGIHIRDRRYVKAFLAYVSDRVAAWGMSDTRLVNPSGLTVQSTSSPRDALKMGVEAMSHPILRDIWHTETQEFRIGGPRARTITVKNNDLSALPEGAYSFLGGKGGSLFGEFVRNIKRRALIAAYEVREQPVLVAIMGDGDNLYQDIFTVAQELCAMLEAKMDGRTPGEGAKTKAMIADGGGYAATILPEHPGQTLRELTPAQLLAREDTVSHNADVVRMPASTSKVWTAYCALEIASDLEQIVEVRASDIPADTSSSGSKYYKSDQLRLIDALRIMMSESSNTMANLVARVCGKMLLDGSARTRPGS